MLGAVYFGIADDGERASCEQAAQVAVALLADSAGPILAPARVLLGHEIDPGREVLPWLEGFGIGHASDQGAKCRHPTSCVAAAQCILECGQQLLQPGIRLNHGLTDSSKTG
jgi:hypothetical protein